MPSAANTGPAQLAVPAAPAGTTVTAAPDNRAADRAPRDDLDGIAAQGEITPRWNWLFSQNRRTRVRVQQSGISFLTYLSGSLVLAWGTSVGAIPPAHFRIWASVLALACLVFFVIARSRIGLRISDAGFTEIQILWGVLTIDAAYAICGEWRSAMLLPMVMAINFGTLSLSGQRMIRVTVMTIVSLGATIALMHAFAPMPLREWRIDIANFAMVTAIIPCAALLSARFGQVRHKLRSQRFALERAIAQIEKMARFDALTGVTNRGHMHTILLTEQQRYERYGEPFTIALLDLDNFKRVNDTYGHGRGDEVLRTFARCAASVLRQSDQLARWGGEEFLILAPAADQGTMYALLERLRTRLRATSHDGLPIDFRISTSCGIAMASQGEPLEELLERADEALYRAKRRGRDRIEEAPPPLGRTRRSMQAPTESNAPQAASSIGAGA